MAAERRLMLLWTRSLCVDEPEEMLRLALAGGVDIVQVREKELSAREVAEQTLRARSIARPFRALVLVNDRVDVARAAEADGVQLGQDDLPIEDARRLLPPGAVIGLSTHSLAQVREARDAGADLIGFGPIFATATKAGAIPIGPRDLGQAEREAGRPLFAIGGLTAAAIEAIGACRAAVSSAILKASDPERAARAIREALEGNVARARS
jgi:thiamine-phosphate pyrophosphorylase